MSLTRYFVTILLLVPMFLLLGFQSLPVDFLLAAIAFAVGHGVEAMIKRSRPQSDSRPADPTRTDQKWELEMLLRKATAAEAREDYQQAIGFFEQAIQRAVERDDAELVRRKIQLATIGSRSSAFQTHLWPFPAQKSPEFVNSEVEAARLLAASEGPELTTGGNPN